MDYGRLVWVPDQTWTASFIANMTQGPVKTFGNFEKTYAVKLDWTGHRKNASVIASSTERRSNELGFFGVWNATDPLLVYTEGRVAEAWDTSMLVGGSYTLDSSAMITVEGFYDRYGTVPLVENLPSRWQILNGVWRPMVSTKVLMAQYNSGTRYRKFNFNLRADHILGDGTRGMAFTNYALGNSLELWSVGIINGGAEGTRFRLYTDHVSLLGMTYTF
ncbi:MAG: hypothetical protein HY815_18955 [Candidatus Riflebacteria bacterium]|nr:hypothetical protein [Candidatus Riflebacteria bacterium]